jgi:hypothetical protein
MPYRFLVVEAEPLAGDVGLKVWLQREESGEWVPVTDALRTLRLGGAEVLTITEDPVMTDNEKRQALKDLFKSVVDAWNIPEALTAYEAMMALLPGGFPIEVDL